MVRFKQERAILLFLSSSVAIRGERRDMDNNLSIRAREEKISRAEAYIKKSAQAIYPWLALSRRMRSYSFSNVMTVVAQSDGRAREVHGYREWEAMGAPPFPNAIPIKVWIWDKDKRKSFPNDAYDISQTPFRRYPERGVPKGKRWYVLENLIRDCTTISLKQGRAFSFSDHEIIWAESEDVENRMKKVLFALFFLGLTIIKDDPRKNYWLHKRNLTRNEANVLSTAAAVTAGYFFGFDWRMTPQQEAKFQSEPRFYLEGAHSLSRTVLYAASSICIEEGILLRNPAEG